MKQEHYEVDWPVVRKKLGNFLTDWLLALDTTQGCVYVYHNLDTNHAQLVAEFYNDKIEEDFIRINTICA